MNKKSEMGEREIDLKTIRVEETFQIYLISSLMPTFSMSQTIVQHFIPIVSFIRVVLKKKMNKLLDDIMVAK